MSVNTFLFLLTDVETFLRAVSSQGAGGVLTDFTSFYTLPSTVMHHPLHRSLKAAYSFYNVHTQTPLLDLMNDSLILAKMVMTFWLLVVHEEPRSCETEMAIGISKCMRKLGSCEPDILLVGFQSGGFAANINT